MDKMYTELPDPDLAITKNSSAPSVLLQHLPDNQYLQQTTYNSLNRHVHHKSIHSVGTLLEELAKTRR